MRPIERLHRINEKLISSSKRKRNEAYRMLAQNQQKIELISSSKDVPLKS